MSTEDYRDQELVFNGLTSDMERIAHDSVHAVSHHNEAYEQALLCAYGRAAEFLRDNPDFSQHMAQTIGLACIEGAQDRYTELMSATALTAHQASGYLRELPEVQLDPVQIRADAMRDAFSTLFASVVTNVRVDEHVFDDREQADEDGLEHELDDPNSINTLDVLEMLEESEFTLVQQAAIAYALQNPTVSAADLRKSVWEIIALPKDEFADFEKQFRTLGYEVALYLRTAGIPAKWEMLVKPRDCGRLLIGEAVQATSHQSGLEQLYGKEFDNISRDRSRTDSEHIDLPDQTSQPKEAVVIDLTVGRGPEATRSTVQDSTLLAFTLQAIAETDGHAPRLTLIGKQIAETFNVTHAEACGQLRSLVERGSLFYGRNHKGSRTLSAHEVTLAQVNEQPKLRKHRESEALTLEDYDVAIRAFDALVSAGHQNKGMTVRTIAIQTGINEVELRMCLNKLAEAGALSKSRSWERSRSPHSRKKQSMFFKFQSQQAWLDYRADKLQFFNNLVQSIDQ